MYDEEREERVLTCGVCGTEIEDKQMCYQIVYGLVIHGRFQSQEPYMTVHSSCLKE